MWDDTFQIGLMPEPQQAAAGDGGDWKAAEPACRCCASVGHTREFCPDVRLYNDGGSETFARAVREGTGEHAGSVLVSWGVLGVPHHSYPDSWIPADALKPTKHQLELRRRAEAAREMSIVPTPAPVYSASQQVGGFRINTDLLRYRRGYCPIKPACSRLRVTSYTPLFARGCELVWLQHPRAGAECMGAGGRGGQVPWRTDGRPPAELELQVLFQRDV